MSHRLLIITFDQDKLILEIHLIDYISNDRIENRLTWTQEFEHLYMKAKE